ncbi:hypothetical protein ZTR_11362 [Talaromyces verruculosus]|nr:hypothetical protein ZTR_11362 [Talaromyces verruculosus]
MESKTYLVRPDTPFDGQYPLSSCDLQVPPVFTSKVLIYSTDNEQLSLSSPKAQGLISRLQDSLKSFLRQPGPGILAYPQLLGQVVRPVDGGEPHIAVKESSAIHFNVVHRPDIKFDSLHHNGRFAVDAINLSDFKVELDLTQSPDSSRNCVIHLTFIDGGFVLLVQVAHQITDASGFAGLIRHWLQRARDGLSADAQSGDSPEAIHDKFRLCQDNIEGVTDGLQRLEVAFKNASAGMKPLASMKSTTRIAKNFWVSAQKLEELRASLQGESPKLPTAFQSIAVLLWRCIVRTRLTPETDLASTESKGFFVTNMRQRLNPPLPNEFFGNSATWVFTGLPISALLDNEKRIVPINDVQKVLQQDTNELNLLLTNQFISRQMKAGVYPPMNLMGYDVLFNSWEHFYPDMKDLDVGLGNFCAMRRMTESITPSLVLILPSYGRRLDGPDDKFKYGYPGGIEVQVHLFSDQMELLQKDPEWLQFATTD